MYRRFLLGAFVGSVGSWIQTTSSGWLVLQLTDSPGLLGLASAANALPTLLLSLQAGVLADRLDRRRLLVSTQLLSASVAAILFLLVVLDAVVFWHVLALTLLAGSAQALATPAFMATIGSLVDRRVLGNAVALNSAQFNLSRMLGPTLAAAAIALGGLAVAFFANALAFLGGALLLLRLPIVRPEAAEKSEASAWRHLLDGFDYVRRDSSVATLLLLATAPGLFLLNYVPLMPVYARDILGVGAPGLGMLNAAMGIGALAGALGVAVLRPSGGSGRLMIRGLAVAATALAVFAVSRWLPLSLAALALLGAAQVAYYATTNTLIQSLVPEDLRGRVMSLYILTALGFIPVGNLLAGAVAERLGAPAALTGGALVTLAVLLAATLARPGLRFLRPEPAPAT